MKRALIRTSFSTIIYEVLDFAVAIYDPRFRMMSQAPSLPMFMGSLSLCVEQAVTWAGGEESLAPGDVLLYNDPFGTGSHAQDVVVIMPIFLDDGTLAGYSAIKAHWLDIGAKDPYCTDTVDVYQEGTVFPALRIYRAGKLDPDVMRLIVVNSRTPTQVTGDLQAQVNGCHVAAEQVKRLIARYGHDRFQAAVDQLFDHGERVMRSYFAQLPDGEYVGHGALDNDGVGSGRIPFSARVVIEGDQVTVDLRDSPGAVPGPMNCPLPTTVSACRVALTMLAGAGEAPTDGHFRALRILTEPGSLFHPERPAPSFLYGWPGLQLIEVILDALGRVPAA
jgi:N-methylhydantoinase B